MMTKIEKNGATFKLQEGKRHNFGTLGQIKKIYVVKDGVETQVYQYDNVAPTLMITSHTPNKLHYMWYDHTTIKGTCYDAHSGVARVTVNGKNATLTNNKTRWVYNLTDIPQTPLECVVRLYDEAGNYVEDKVSYKYIPDDYKYLSNAYVGGGMNGSARGGTGWNAADGYHFTWGASPSGSKLYYEWNARYDGGGFSWDYDYYCSVRATGITKEMNKFGVAVTHPTFSVTVRSASGKYLASFSNNVGADRNLRTAYLDLSGCSESDLDGAYADIVVSGWGGGNTNQTGGSASGSGYCGVDWTVGYYNREV